MGPIVSGEVDLKPLTIFIGPSNTGKSYMATAIYALMKAFEGLRHRLWTRSLREDRVAFGGPHVYSSYLPGLDDAPVDPEAFNTWVRQRAVDVEDRGRLTVAHLPSDVRSTLEELTAESLDVLRNNSRSELRRVFGDPSHVVKLRSGARSSGLTIHRDNPLLRLRIGLHDGQDCVPIFDISQAKAPTPGDDIRAPTHPHEETLRWLWDEFVYGMRDSVSGAITYGIPMRVFYLPSARSGVVQSFTQIAGDQVTHPSSALSGSVADLISHLLIMADSRGSDQIQEVVSFIESEVTHGVVAFENSRELAFPEIKYWPAWDPKGFAITRTSSMVSDLAPLVLFLKHLIWPGDLLILEEPEAHLHPAAQRQMARALVRLVNAGVKVLITTHSEFMLSQINNLMRLSHASRQTIRKYGYAPQDCLSQDDVSAYAFRLRDEHDGSTVEELQIDPDVGIDEDEFAVVASDLYDETVSFQRIRFK